MKILWTQPTGSGLADRLNDLIIMGTYTKAHNATLYMNWPRFPASDIDVEHRKTDILLENVQQFINLPPYIVFNSQCKPDKTFTSYIGGTCDPNAFYLEYLKDICSKEQFDSIRISVTKDFSFCPAINEYLQTIPNKFVTFHIRRGDKVRNTPHDNTFILNNELDWLNAMTYKALDHYFDLGYNDFFFCGDEDHKTAPFTDYAKSKGKNIFSIPPMVKWQSTYYDLATMTKSEHNITSQRYSSFSFFPSTIGGGKFSTVFGLHNEGVI